MSHSLGGRLPLLNPHELTAEQKKTYDIVFATMIPWAQSSGFKAKNDDGALIGPFNCILLSPQISAAFLALQEAEQKRTTLSARIRQVVILTVGAVWECDYERYAHSAVARKLGLPDDAIRALASGTLGISLSGEERLAQRFTRQITSERQVDDDLYELATDAFGQQGVVDLLYLAGCYVTISSMLNTFRVPAPA